MRKRVFRASVLHDGKPYEIRRLEQAQIQNRRLDAEVGRDSANDLALAHARGALEQDGATRAISNAQEPLEPRSDGNGERAKRVACRPCQSFFPSKGVSVNVDTSRSSRQRTLIATILAPPGPVPLAYELIPHVEQKRW